MSNEILYETRGPLAIITINRPESRNAINRAVRTGLRDAFQRFDADPARSDLSSLDALWESQPDAAVIATPPETHIDLAMQAARLDCDLFIEKPLALKMDGLIPLGWQEVSRDLVTHVACLMLLTNSPSISDVILFPHMRPESSNL